jgi:hypothetical protein
LSPNWRERSELLPAPKESEPRLRVVAETLQDVEDDGSHGIEELIVIGVHAPMLAQQAAGVAVHLWWECANTDQRGNRGVMRP